MDYFVLSSFSDVSEIERVLRRLRSPSILPSSSDYLQEFLIEILSKVLQIS